MLDVSGKPLLAVEGLHAWYGESHILHGSTFEVRAGEVVTLLGRNGAGKTTTLKSIMGIVPRRTGSIRYEGEETIDLASNRIARRGIACECGLAGVQRLRTDFAGVVDPHQARGVAALVVAQIGFRYSGSR